MSEMPNQISIQGEVKGQIAIGNYINQFQNLNGCNINIMSPDQRPKWERQDKPVQIKPRPPETFLNRTTEINLIEASISAAKPLAVSGIAGIGKTTLLKQLAHRVCTDPFPDGIFWFSAYDLKLEDMLQCVFSAFYNSNIPVKPDRAEIQKALQDVRALILIDDLQLTHDETLILLDVAPCCTFVLASTGQVLHSPSAMIRLSGLPENEGLLLFEQELGRSLEENERQLVCEINHMLQGHPEKICLLAAELREEGVTLNEAILRLRSSTLESLVLDSVQILPQVEQQILAILAAVEGRTMPHEHMAALLSSQLSGQETENLLARGLVQSHSPAYSISETVLGMLARSWETSPWDQATINYFVRWLEQKPSTSSIADVQDILLVLIKKAAQRKMWPAVIALGRALEPLLIMRGYWDAWKEILNLVLDASTSLGNRALEGWVLHQMGSRSLCLGSSEEASQLLRKALGIRRSIGDHAGAALTKHNLSLITGTIPLERGGKAAASSQTLQSTMAILATIAVAITVVTAILLYRPNPPTLTFPENEIIQTSGMELAFEWQSEWGAATYQIQVDDQQDFSSPVIDLKTAMTRPTPSMDLKQGIYYWRVRAISRFNRAGSWSEIRKFTISIPPGPFTLTQPADQSMETKPETLVFTWERAGNGAYYMLQLDDNSDFSSPMYESKLPENQYSPPVPLAQGMYYWHVRAFNAFDTPGDWSTTWSFTVSIAPTGVPGLVEPKDGSKLESTDRPAFKWQGVQDATQYHIQVDESATFDSPLLDTPVSDVGLVPTRALVQGVYHWRVRALNTYGTPGEWSSIWSFTISIRPDIPTLIRPANGSMETATTTPTFEWSRGKNAVHYQIQVDNDQNFNSLVFENRMTETSTTPSLKLAQGDYYWRVQAFNAYDTSSNWSATWRFTISIAPDIPVLVAPSNNSIIESTTTPTFSWQSLSDTVQYQIQVDNSPAFDSLEYESIDPSTSRSSTVGLSQGVYSWRVRALNEYKTPGPWSETWQFTVSIPPGIPTLLEPYYDSYVYINKPVFKWQGVANAAYYQIQVDNSPSLSSPEYGSNVSSTSHNFSQGFSQGKYYWHVRAVNTYGTPGPWSSPSQFTISIPPGPPVLLEPVNGSYAYYDAKIYFKWKSVQNGAYYQVQVDNSSTFNSPEKEYTTPGADLQSGFWLLNGTYYWRVRAFNLYNTPGDWSSIWQLTVISPPTAPTLYSPANGAFLTTLEIEFSWYPVETGSSYQIQVDDVNTFNSPQMVTTINSTQIKISRSALITGSYKCGQTLLLPYVWRVRAKDSFGMFGPWSKVWGFTLKFFSGPC